MSIDQNAGQVLWVCGDYDWENSNQSIGKAGARMYRLHDQITIEAVHYDHEDNREYYNRGIFSIAGYLKAFQEMETNGRAEITESGNCLTLKKAEEFVELRLSSVPYPATTPGGAHIVSTCDFGKIHIDKLRLQN